MKKIYVYASIAVIALVIVGALIVNKQVVQPMLDDRTVADVVGYQIESPEFNLAFRYPSGLEGYTLIEPPVATTSISLKKAYLMFQYDEYIEYQNNQTQTPPAVSVFVFKLPDKSDTDVSSRSERLLQWLSENPQYTSYDRRVAEIEDVELDGVAAIKYSTEGIYTQDFHIASYSGNIYVFAGQYENAEDKNIETYANLISSVTFK
jgi:hypothetical protein